MSFDFECESNDSENKFLFFILFFSENFMKPLMEQGQDSIFIIILFEIIFNDKD